MDVGRVRSVQKQNGSLYDRWFTRRTSRYVTAMLLRVGMTRPNIVTAVNTVLGLVAWVLIAFDMSLLLGVAFIHVYAVLDSVDGELARATGKSSLRGMFLEDYSAYLMINGFWLAMGVHLARDLSTIWPLVASGLYVSFGRAVMPAARRAIMKSAGERELDSLKGNTLGALAATDRLSKGIRFLLVETLHPSTVWAVTTTILLIERALGTEHMVLVAAFIGYLMLSVARELGALGRFMTHGVSTP